nr:aminotransferase class I/II-fold pyridoxal phosphate-dependent enzyme [Bacteroidales bacterium]
MYTRYQQYLQKELASIEEAGLFKKERIIVSPQGAVIKLNTGKEVLNFCANNYLGLSSDRELIAAAKEALDSHGYGMSSVRFICGTTNLHKELEAKVADFFGTEDSILYAACFDANGGVFEPLLGEEDAIISDALNHASIYAFGTYMGAAAIETLGATTGQMGPVFSIRFLASAVFGVLGGRYLPATDWRVTAGACVVCALMSVGAFAF